jgi:hypothetical protein
LSIERMMLSPMFRAIISWGVMMIDPHSTVRQRVPALHESARSITQTVSGDWIFARIAGRLHIAAGSVMVAHESLVRHPYPALLWALIFMLS